MKYCSCVLSSAVAALMAAALGAASLQAANHYVTPSGAGALNGTSWANALSQSQLQTAINALVAGDSLNVGSGTYTVTSLSISGDGTLENPRRLIGVDTGAGLPLFQGTYNVATSASSSFVSFPAGANHWQIKNLRFMNQPFVIDMPLNGTTDTLRSNILFENLTFDSVEDAIRIRNARNITVKNCSVIRHTKKAFRIGRYSSFVTFEGCSTDCNGGDASFPARSIPNGFAGDDTGGLPLIHGITFIDCTARNNRFSQNPASYWNGDGFATEEGTYNVTYIGCKSFDNHDGGFDDKADNLLYQDCVAAGNKRGFRYWGNSGQMLDSVSAFNTSWGGIGGAEGVWVSETGGVLAIDFSTIHGNGATQVYGEPGATISVANSIISTPSSTIPFTTSVVTMTNTVTYRPGSGTNPDYVNPVSTWRGTPANAMDSQTYGTTKGYYSVAVTNVAPTLSISATPTSGTAPLGVNFSASATDADGVIAGYAWTFGNGWTSSVQNPSTTYTSAGNYTVSCTVTDNLGATTTQSTTITVSPPSSGATLRIESGGGSAFTDASGNVWAADHSYGSGGGIVDRGAIAIANTNDDRIYQTERWGLSSYAVTLANGTYTVRLHFAETYTGITAAGQRVFTVTAEGATPSGWSNIDVFAQAGGRNIALIKTATVTVADGILNLGFSATANNPMISGIEIVPTAPATDGLTSITGPATVTRGSTHSVAVAYSAAGARFVVVEFRNPGNGPLTSNTVTVPAGSGTTTVSIVIPSEAPTGTGYRWTAKLKSTAGNIEYARTDQLNVTVE